MVREETGRGKDRFKISELFADGRCSKAILDFLATTEVGRTGPTGGGRGTKQRGLGMGKEGTRGIPCTVGGRKRGCWERGRKISGWGDYRLSFFLFTKRRKLIFKTMS